MTSKGFEDFLLRGNVVELAMTAAVIHSLVVLPTEALVERRTRGEEPGPARPTQSSCWPRSATCCAPSRAPERPRPRPEARREPANGEEDGRLLQGPAASLRVVGPRKRVLPQSLPQCGGRSST